MTWGKVAQIASGVGLIGLIGIVLFPANLCDHDRWSSMQSICRSNLKVACLALQMYAEDNNDRLPEAKWWMGATMPYSKSESPFSCPWVPNSTDDHFLRYTVNPGKPESDLYSGVFGHAMSSLQSRLSEVEDQTATVLLFDSTDPTWNSFGPVDTPRYRDYRGKKGAMVSFMSGSTKFVPESEWEKLK